jgi:hypothetical protein
MRRKTCVAEVVSCSNHVYSDISTLCITVIRRGEPRLSQKAFLPLAQCPTTLPSRNYPTFILSLPIFSHYYPPLSNRPLPKTPHMISSSNQMYIVKVGRYSFAAHESAFGTDLPMNQKNPRSLNPRTIVARGFSYMYISSHPAVCIAVKSMKEK